MRLGFLIGLVALACVPIPATPAQVASNDSLSSAAKVGELQKRGELAAAVTEAERAVETARSNGDDASLALSLQMLGLALARADRPDEALRVADELKGIPGTVSWMAVQAEVALSHCAFDEASELYLKVRAQSPSGSNDAPTEGGLAAIDLAEGRTERAIERLEHASRLGQPSTFPKETWEQVQSAIRRGLASAYARVGRHPRIDRADAALLRSSALHIADYALKENRALHLAYDSLVSAILAGNAIGAPAKPQAELRERLRRVLEKYETSGGACHAAIPDPLAQETPGARLQLLPPRAAVATKTELVNPFDASSPRPSAPSDRDADGIPDDSDRCPDQAEVVNGVDDADGCPDEAPGRLVGREIRVREQIQFATDSDRIEASAKPTLDWVAKLLATHPEIRHVSIEGHTDDAGSETHNLDLSRRRARAVLDALVKRGIEPGRVSSTGFGESRPKLLGSDATARAANRRVEMIADLAMPAAAPPPTPAPTAKTAGKLVIEAQALMESVSLELSADGKVLAGPFDVKPEADTSFEVPAGKLHWKHLDTNCEDEGDVDVPERGQAVMECWTSNHMGHCCKTGTLGDGN